MYGKLKAAKKEKDEDNRTFIETHGEEAFNAYQKLL